MANPLTQALGFSRPEISEPDQARRVNRPLTAGELDQLRSLRQQVLVATGDVRKAERTAQQQAALFLSQNPEPPGLIDNTIQDVSELVHGVGTLLGQVAIEGVVDPIGQLIAGDPSAAANEVVDAGQKALRVGALLPGAIIQGLKDSAIGALAQGDLGLALTRAHRRPFTTALDVSFAAGAASKVLGAVSKAGKASQVANTLGRVSRAIDPAIAVGRAVSRVGAAAERGGIVNRIISASVGGAVGTLAGGPLVGAAGAALGSLAPIVGGVSKFLRSQSGFKRYMRRLAPVERELFSRIIGRVYRGESGLNELLPKLHRLPPAQNELATTIVRAGLEMPANATPEMRAAVLHYRAAFGGTEGTVNKALDELNVLSFAEQEVRNTGHMLAERAKLGLEDPRFPLDRFRVLAKEGGPELSQFIEDFRRSLPDGVDLTYVSYQSTDNAISTMLQWTKSAFGGQPKPGFLKASQMKNVMNPDFQLDLAKSVELLQDQLAPMIKFQSRMEAVLADPLTTVVSPKAYQRIVQGVVDEMATEARRLGNNSASVNEFSQRLARALTDQFGSLEGKVLFSPDIALGAIRSAEGALKGLRGGLARGEHLTAAINRTMQRRLGRNIALDDFAQLAVDDFPRLGIAPRELVEAFQESLPSFGPFAELIDVAIDRPLQFLKRSWLGWSPSWAMNTVAGNVLLSAFGGSFNPRDYIRALRPEVQELVPLEVGMGFWRNVSAGQLERGAKMASNMKVARVPSLRELGEGLAGPMYSLTGHIDQWHRSTRYLRSVAAMKPKGVMEDLVAHFGRTATGHDELLGRLRTLRAVTVDELVEAGVSRARAPAALKQVIAARRKAVGDVTRFFGDYNTLTRFERAFVKRLVPFYEWWRHMAVLGITAPVKMPGRTKFLQLLVNVVRDAEDEELQREFGLDRSQLASFFEASTDATRLREVMSKVGESDHGLQILGALAGALFGGGVAGLPGVAVGAAAGAVGGAQLPKAAFTSHPERELAPLMMTTALNPFETTLDVAQSALAWLGMGTVDPDLKAGVISGAIAPQVTIPIEAIFGINLFTGQRFRKVTESGVTVEVGEEGLMVDPTAPRGLRRVRYGGVWDVLFTRLGDSLPQFKHLQRLVTPFRESGSRVTGPDELLGILSDVLQGKDTERARLALRDPVTREPIPQSRYVSALRMFGVNLKEVDVARRRVSDVKWTRRKLSEQFNSWMRASPRAAEFLASSPNLVQPLAARWVRQQAKRKARTAHESFMIDQRAKLLAVDAE